MIEKPLRVLLVEDDPDDAYLLDAMLRDVPTLQYELTRATRLAQALRSEQTFDVALLDLSLPDSHGIATFLELHERWPELPIVVLTGLDDETIATRAVHEGAQDYLIKGQVNGHLLERSLRYAVERQRTTYFRALLTERERFDTAVSQMTDGIVVMDDQWRINHANRAASLLLNLPAEGWRDLVLSQALEPFTTSVPVPDLLASTEHVTGFEIARRATPPPLLLDGRLSRLFDQSGALVSAVLMLRDVTDQRLERNIKADFMTAVPHKLRTPLTVLLGYLTVARRLPPAELLERWPQISQVWEAELRRLVDVVQKLLSFETLGALYEVTESEPADVAAVVAGGLEHMRSQHPGRSIETEVHLADAHARANCRPEHLSFVLEELLDNAVKFADKEPVRVTISLLHDDPAVLALSVADNGPGIPHEYYDRIFDDFVQIEEHVTGQVPGLGIGLRMARQVVEACGGTITACSCLGEGSVFTFTLPAAESV
jgi:signal transduction histidine kinase